MPKFQAFGSGSEQRAGRARERVLGMGGEWVLGMVAELGGWR